MMTIETVREVRGNAFHALESEVLTTGRPVSLRAPISCRHESARRKSSQALAQIHAGSCAPLSFHLSSRKPESDSTIVPTCCLDLDPSNAPFTHSVERRLPNLVTATAPGIYAPQKESFEALLCGLVTTHNRPDREREALPAFFDHHVVHAAPADAEHLLNMLGAFSIVTARKRFPSTRRFLARGLGQKL
jgi:hypothetical protein